MAIQAKEGRAEQKVEGFKQQLTAQPTLEPVDTFVELEEIVEETEDDKEEETPIIDCQERIKKKEEQEKQKQKEEKKSEKWKRKEKVNEEKKKGKRDIFYWLQINSGIHFI